MKIHVEGSTIVSIDKNKALQIDTNGANSIELETNRGHFKIYERNGEIDVSFEGCVVWSSYDATGDSWKDWGPATKKTPSK